SQSQLQGQISTLTQMQTQSNIFEVEWFGASDKGKKPHMEDRRIEMPVLSQHCRLPYFQHNQFCFILGNSQIAFFFFFFFFKYICMLCGLFGILDGHGGYKVASYLQKHLPQIFFEHYEKYVKNEASANNHNQGIPPLEGDITNHDNNNNVDMKQGESQGKIFDVQKCLHSTFKITDEKVCNKIYTKQK
ncbi:hypothetical protein RFI_07520, partial [Reticulomyxa filosa]